MAEPTTREVSTVADRAAFLAARVIDWRSAGPEGARIGRRLQRDGPLAPGRG